MRPENSGKPWSDYDLRIVLSHAPTKANCEMLAERFKRGTGSIELIFGWACTSKNRIDERNRSSNKAIQQYKRIAKEMGWLTLCCRPKAKKETT